MWNSRKQLGLLLVVWLATYLKVAAQSDDRSTCPESKLIEKKIDSLTEHLGSLWVHFKKNGFYNYRGEVIHNRNRGKENQRR